MRIAGAGAKRDLPRSKKTRALLAYLAMTARPHRRDRLCAMFWDAPDDPRGSLRWSLSKLRGLVDAPGRARLRADRETVEFESSDVEIDALNLRRRLRVGPDLLTTEELADVAVAFRGEFLEGLDLESCPDFHSWCLAERQELRILQGRVLKRLSTQLAAQPAAALPYVRALVQLDPFDEASRAMLVRVLAAGGRRDEAEKQYELSLRTLADLGAPPSGELARAWREVLGSPAAIRPLLDAIDPPRPSGDATEPGTVQTEPTAERKQVTVLVALAGRPAELDADGDPEVAMQELDPALETMKDIVRRYEGIVSVAQPDGLTAIFGAPVAHEDHAVRACHAAMAMQAAVRNSDGSPALRVGLHSGEAVVRTIRDGASPRFEAVGPVVSLAGRVGTLAGPGVTLATRETARRAEGFIQSRPFERESAELRHELVALEGSTPARTRWEVRSDRGLSPFIGRDAEMATLLGALRRVKSGSGEIVAVVADPGIGKSRLMHEFLRSAVPQGWSVLETSAVSHDAKATYRPISGLLRTWAGVEERDLKPAIERKVRARIEDLQAELQPALPALMSLLDLPATETDWPTFSPPQRRRRTLDAIKALLAAECRGKPLVLLFEDLHWIDGETQAVLDTLVDSLAGLKLLLLVTHRPEYRHDWSGKSYFSQIRLHPLAADVTEQLVRSLVGEDPSTGGLRRDLVARTEGTPLFVEETVRALVEAGTLAGQPGNYRQGRPVAAFEIPSTIQAVIAARIDRLPPASKNLLQAASVIGRDIPLPLLRHVSGLAEERLHEALADLRAAEFLYEVHRHPGIVHTFKHALTQEVAYGSVLRERRRAIHIEIVQTIEKLYRDRIDEQVEHLARHAVKGRLWEQAVRYLFRAASKAIQRSAYRQAIEFLHQGLELIPKLPDAQARLRTELDYQKAIGVTMMAAKGWGAQEVSDAYVRAQTLAETLADDRELFVVLRGQGQFHMIRGEVQIARGFGDRCAALAEKVADREMKLEAHHLFWSNNFFVGHYASVGHHAEQGIASYDRARDHRLTIYSGHDPGVCCRCFAGLAHWQRGETEQALVRCQEALALATDLKHPLTTALAYWGLSYVHMFRLEPAKAQESAEREIAICEEYLLPLLLSQGQFQLGWALAAQDMLGEGIALMRKGLEAIRATGAEMGRPYFSALLGEAIARSGRPGDGLAEIESALGIVEKSRAYYQLPEMQRLKGEMLLRLPDYDLDSVTACFRDAMATAQEQGTPLAELRAGTSLARVLIHKRKRSEARRLLSDLSARISGIPDSAELREARMLLAD